MSRDPRVYTNPLEFRPERHMGDKPEQDPLLYVFGFGRRICPGMELAQTSLFLAIAGAVATMRIEKAIGEDGKPIVPSREMEGILLR
jgi:cytochrome P450